jgi:hypothetical protein
MRIKNFAKKHTWNFCVVIKRLIHLQLRKLLGVKLNNTPEHSSLILK